MAVCSSHQSMIDRIRRFATCYHYDEVQFNTVSRVIAFKDKERNVRINIYYSTGTVGTSLFHPNQGATQLFRYQCSLEEIEKIFRNPRVHTDKGYHRRTDLSYIQSLPRKNNQGEDDRQIGDEATELRQAIVEMKENRRQIDQQIEEATARLRSIELFAAQEEEKRREEERKRQRAEEERQRRAAAEQRRRKKAQEEERKRQQKELQIIERGDKVYHNACHYENIDEMFSPNTKCIAMVGEATLMLDDDGGSSWTGGDDIPNKVRNVLISQSKIAANYCALGSYGRYYLSIGQNVYWSVPNSLAEILETSSAMPECIAFGEGYDDYIAIFANDEIYWCGNFHGTLHSILNDQQPMIDFVSVGKNGTFFVRFTDGQIVLKKPPQSLNRYYAQPWFRERLRSVIFNESNHWIARIRSK